MSLFILSAQGVEDESYQESKGEIEELDNNGVLNGIREQGEKTMPILHNGAG